MEFETLNQIVQSNRRKQDQIPLSLRQNFSWTFVGNVVYAACQWLMLMIMAKFGNANMVGQFSLGLAITAPVFMFTNLQLQGILATDRSNTYSFSCYLGLRICTIIIALVTISLIVIMGDYPIKTRLVILLVGISKAAESISEVIYGLLQKNERMDRISISLMIKGIFSVVLLSILLLTTDSIVISVLGFAISSLLVLLIFDINNARRYEILRPIVNFTQLFPLVRLSLPMGIVMLLISLNSNIPRYFIEHYLGTEKLGYFSAMAYIMVAGNTVVSALGQSASPRLSKYYASGNKLNFLKLLLKLLAIGICLGVSGVIIVLILGEKILTLIYHSDYANYTSIFVLVMINAGINYISSFLGYSMTAARLFKIQPLIFSFVTMVSTILCAILIPFKGLQGAVYAMIIASLVQLVGSALINIYAIKKIKKEEKSIE